MPSLGPKDISRELQHAATGSAKRSPPSVTSDTQQPQPKRQKTQKHERSMDEAEVEVFRERILSNRECDWSAVVRMLEQVGTKWIEHSQVAKRTTTDWRALESGERMEGSKILKQKRAKDLLRATQREQAMLLRTAARYVTVTLAYSSAASKAKIPQSEQFEKIRRSLIGLRRTRTSLAVTVADIENYLEEVR
ncbi:hypothetical protein Q1695_001097 [Nippostrongylus brasiliensis]|nr:hypothetical protein Q1695_001097 [Nippostrongylus brasiliensis]